MMRWLGDIIPSPGLPPEEFQRQTWRWMRAVANFLREVARKLRLRGEVIVDESPAQSGGAGPLLPSGGLTGQVLAKVSEVDYDVSWRTVREVPAPPSSSGYLLASSYTLPFMQWVPIASVVPQSSGHGAGSIPDPVVAGLTLVSQDVVVAYDDLGNPVYAPRPQWALKFFVPSGGDSGQVLAKASGMDGDVTWQSLPPPQVFYGSGSPEGVVAASPPALYYSSGGGLWCKFSGVGNTGWVPLLAE